MYHEGQAFSAGRWEGERETSSSSYGLGENHYNAQSNQPIFGEKRGGSMNVCMQGHKKVSWRRENAMA